jgi:chromosome segregation ATPase
LRFFLLSLHLHTIVNAIPSPSFNSFRQKRELKIEKDEGERKHREMVQKTGQLDRQITVNRAKLADIEKSIRTCEAKAAENRQTIEEERREASSKIRSELDEVKKKMEEEDAEIKQLQERKRALEEEKASLTRKLNSSSPVPDRSASPNPGFLHP